MKKLLLLIIGFVLQIASFGQVTTISQTNLGGGWYSGVDQWGGQSFTINQAGEITEIRFYTYTAEGLTTFEIREGQNIAGSLLYTTSINISVSGWISVPVPNIPVCEGQYCFLLSGFQWGAMNTANPYTEGDLYYSGSWIAGYDMSFEVDQIINQEPVSPSTFNNISVCQGANFPTTNYTITDETPATVVASATSSNTAVIPVGNIILGGAGPNRTIDFTSPAITTGSTTITLTLDDGNCSNDYTFVVTVNGPPSVSAGANQTVCSGDAVTLSGSGTAISYAWDNGVSDGTSFFPGVGSINYMVTGSDANGCLNTDMVTVNVNPLPTTSLTCSDADQIICAGDVVTFTATGATNYEYFVNGSSVQGPSGASSYVTSSLISGDVVSVSGESAGCSFIAPQTFTFTVNALPSVSFSPISPLCANDAAYSLTEGSPAGGVYSGTGVSGAFFNPSVAGVGTHTLTYTYTDGNGCSDFATQNVVVNAPPVVNAGADVTICEGNTTTLSGLGASSYIWDNGLGAGATHVVSPSTTTLYTVTGPAVNGCQNSDSVLVTVNALPNVNFGPIPDQCLMAGSYTLTEGSPAGGTYSGPGVSAGAFLPSSVGTGTFELFYTFIDGNGCQNIDSNTVLVYNNPSVVANASGLNLCDGDQLTLTGSGAQTYFWDNGVSDGVSFTPSVGTVNYGVFGSDANGCSDSDYVSVTVNPLPTVNAGLDQTVCEGNSILLNASGADSYVWDNGATDNTSFIPSLGSTIYTVVGTDLNGCQNYDDVQITVNPNPLLTISPDQTFCLGDSISLTASGASTYDWDFGASAGSNFIVSPINSLVVNVEGTSNFGCSSQGTINLTLDDPSQISAGSDQSVCLGFTANLSASGGVSYLWNGPVISNETTQDISFIVDTSGFYSVQIETDNGCNYSDSVFIEASLDPSCTIDVVSSITPNNDGINDTWRIQGIEGFPENNVSIFNRWGDLVFQEDGYDNELIVWDGTNNGNELGAGTYFFVIEIANGPSSSGWIQLMK